MSKLQVVTLTCTSVCVFVVLPTHGTNIYLALGIEEFENEPKDCILKLFTFWSLGGRISHKTTYGCGNSCLSALLPFLLLAPFDGCIGHWTSTDAVALRTRIFGDVGMLRHDCN